MQGGAEAEVWREGPGQWLWWCRTPLFFFLELLTDKQILPCLELFSDSGLWHPGLKQVGLALLASFLDRFNEFPLVLCSSAFPCTQTDLEKNPLQKGDIRTFF